LPTPDDLTKTPTTLSQDKVRRYKCPGCGADLLFEPKNGALTCPFCEHQERIPESKEEIVEQSYEKYLQLRPDQLQALAPNALEVACTSCGAQVIFQPPQVAGKCGFCGAPIVAQPKVPDPILCPEAVLPFRLAKDEAAGAIQRWISSRWLAPNDLKRFAVTGEISGMYVPFWTYDAYTNTHYSGQRGDYYYETEYYTEVDSEGKSVQSSRQVQRTSWHLVSGSLSRWFDDVLVSGTKSLRKDHLEQLEPWDLSELKVYDPSFLAGYLAQRYETGVADGFEQAKLYTSAVIQSDVRRDIGGDEQRVFEVDTNYSAITFKHILLPVYVGAYHLHNKLFQLVVNARTGEVQGERPYSWIKITLLVLTIIAIVAALIIWYQGQTQY